MVVPSLDMDVDFDGVIWIVQYRGHVVTGSTWLETYYLALQVRENVITRSP